MKHTKYLWLAIGMAAMAVTGACTTNDVDIIVPEEPGDEGSYYEL